MAQNKDKKPKSQRVTVKDTKPTSYKFKKGRKDYIALIAKEKGLTVSGVMDLAVDNYIIKYKRKKKA